MSETALKPANQNPWYVLMTLYGEQTGEDVDWDLHEKNRAAWNAWAGQAIGGEERAKAAASSKVTVEELSAWPELREQVARQHKKVMLKRNEEGFDYPGLPDVGAAVDLSNVAFEHQVTMRGAVFSKSSTFDGAAFSGWARFESATFSGQAWFISATFSIEASFAGATFSRWARFDHATFGRQAFLSFVTFSEKAEFRGAKFIGWAWFGSTMFSGFANFPGTEFGVAGEDQRADFIDCQFEKSTNFREAIFHARYPDFSGTVLQDRTTFTDHSDNWPKGSQPDPGQAMASCATIRHYLGKQGLPEAEHFFYRREMAFAGQSGPILQRPPYWLFGWFSDYGYSILAPFLWLLLLIALGAYVLAWGLAGGAQAVSFEHGFGLSFSNVFNFLGFHRTFVEADFTLKLPQWLKVVSAFQTIFGVVLLFFLGLGLRTRFRLR